MKRKTIEHLGPLQKRVMEVIWKKGKATVQEVKSEIDPGKNLAYTTVLCAVQKLKKEGWLDREELGRAHVFSPAMSREKEGGRSLKKLLTQIFHGDSTLLFQNLIQQTNLSTEELDEFRRMIDERKEGLRK